MPEMVMMMMQPDVDLDQTASWMVMMAENALYARNARKQTHHDDQLSGKRGFMVKQHQNH